MGTQTSSVFTDKERADMETKMEVLKKERFAYKKREEEMKREEELKEIKIITTNAKKCIEAYLDNPSYYVHGKEYFCKFSLTKKTTTHMTGKIIKKTDSRFRYKVHENKYSRIGPGGFQTILRYQLSIWM